MGLSFAVQKNIFETHQKCKLLFRLITCTLKIFLQPIFEDLDILTVPNRYVLKTLYNIKITFLYIKLRKLLSKLEHHI